VCAFFRDCFCGLGLGLEGAGLGLGLETTGLGLETLVLTTRLSNTFIKLFTHKNGTAVSFQHNIYYST